MGELRNEFFGAVAGYRVHKRLAHAAQSWVYVASHTGVAADREEQARKALVKLGGMAGEW